MKPQNIPLFEHWYRTTNWVLDRCEQYPKHTRFTISSRISAIALEIIEDIVQAIYQKNKRPLLQNVNRRLETLRILFRLSFDRKYISAKQYEYISKAINEAGRMTGGWLKSLSA